MTRIDQFSLTTAPIEQLFNNVTLGAATGFIWKTNERFYLVTNWHVVTCRRFPHGENLHPQGGWPNKLKVLLNPRAYEFGKVEYTIAIRDQDGRPLWLAHPGRNVDIAVVPLPLDGTEPDVNLYPINTLTSLDLVLRIGMDVFILGYPFGAEPPGFPVWKRGSIASEPDLVRLSSDYLLVDSASRSGMSGAPVIRRSWGTHLLDGDITLKNGRGGTKFVGIYSGRLHTRDTDDAQIAMVWHPSFIDEIIAGGKLDEDLD